MKRLVRCLHFIYKRTLSVALGPRCRFYPFCSDYCLEACERFGVLRGAALTLCRLCHCHPWHPGGHDPVPEQFCWKDCITVKKEG